MKNTLLFVSAFCACLYVVCSYANIAYTLYADGGGSWTSQTAADASNGYTYDGKYEALQIAAPAELRIWLGVVGSTYASSHAKATSGSTLVDAWNTYGNIELKGDLVQYETTYAKTVEWNIDIE